MSNPPSHPHCLCGQPKGGTSLENMGSRIYLSSLEPATSRTSFARTHTRQATHPPGRYGYSTVKGLSHPHTHTHTHTHTHALTQRSVPLPVPRPACPHLQLSNGAARSTSTPAGAAHGGGRVQAGRLTCTALCLDTSPRSKHNPACFALHCLLCIFLFYFHFIRPRLTAHGVRSLAWSLPPPGR